MPLRRAGGPAEGRPRGDRGRGLAAQQGGWAGGQAHPPPPLGKSAAPLFLGRQTTTASQIPEARAGPRAHSRVLSPGWMCGRRSGAAALGAMTSRLLGVTVPRGEAGPEPHLFPTSPSRPGHGGCGRASPRPSPAHRGTSPACSGRQLALARLPLEVAGGLSQPGALAVIRAQTPTLPPLSPLVLGSLSRGFSSRWFRT